jgi:hypothetical protein
MSFLHPAKLFVERELGSGISIGQRSGRTLDQLALEQAVLVTGACNDEGWQTGLDEPLEKGDLDRKLGLKMSRRLVVGQSIPSEMQQNVRTADPRIGIFGRGADIDFDPRGIGGKALAENWPARDGDNLDAWCVGESAEDMTADEATCASDGYFQNIRSSGMAVANCPP